MSKVNLTPEVRDVLERSTITDNSLILPDGQLERKLYTAVNKIIELAGGKWNKKTKAHLFESDPREKLGLTLETGSIVDEKKARQAFYTPDGLAAYVATLASVDGHDVLEPSAGNGQLAKACMNSGARSVYCFEIDVTECVKLWAAGFVTKCEDFLTQFEDIKDGFSRFKRIVMNPPFTKNQDLKHVRHAADNWLTEDGILVSIISPNIQRTLFEELNEDYDITVENVEAGTFKESGTSIATKILFLTHKTEKDI